jgi:OOP family OmpA-OmpF porin
MAISYIQGLTNHLDIASTLSASFLDYPIPGKALQNDNYLLLEGAVTGNLKLVPDNYWVDPFITLGIGASKFKGYYGAFAPVGIGVQVNLFDDAFFLLNSQYRVPITENVGYHFYHSVGFGGALTKRKVPAPVELPKLPVINYDRDNDGVPDSVDRCPDTYGLAKLKGCPDRDGDGIADIDDKCPDVPGLARYQGCPIPDRDKDGINDEEDKCPDVPGLARYQGCPIPDTDKDGVNDEEDKCILEPGPASNFGCPLIDETIIKKINKLLQNVYFATGKSNLLPKSFPPLNEVAKVMNDNPHFYANIDGHTDSTGQFDKNMVLSNDRAASVMTYLVGKGVKAEHLTSTGYGPTKPIASNKTAAGRALNRRVEMHVRNYK